MDVGWPPGGSQPQVASLVVRVAKKEIVGIEPTTSLEKTRAATNRATGSSLVLSFGVGGAKTMFFAPKTTFSKL